jgi:hypothetical protein
MTKNKNKISRQKKRVEELQAASDALEYELRMLNEVTIMLPKHQFGVIHNAMVESYVVHMRILIEFFYPTSRAKNDPDTIIVSDFLYDVCQPKNEIHELLKNNRERAHKLLAHLSYSRVQKYKNDKAWPYPIITENLNNLFRDFFKNVPEDRIGNKLRKYKALMTNDDILF